MAETTPTTRWAAGGRRNDGYGARFAELVAAGEDVDGEARLADALLQRGSRVLDAGAGMGRVGAALAARGHDVLAAEPDAALVAQCRATYPHLEVVESDILGLDPDVVGTFDLVVVVGNVLIYLAEGTERAVLARLRSLLAPGGRVLAGFHPVDGPTNSRAYPPEELVADAEASGLRVDLRAGGYQLQPPEEGYAVWLLSRDDERPQARTHTTPFSAR